MAPVCIFCSAANKQNSSQRIGKPELYHSFKIHLKEKAALIFVRKKKNIQLRKLKEGWKHKCHKADLAQVRLQYL